MKKKLVCIQRLDENNLINVGSTKPIWTSMWLPKFNGFWRLWLERFFISLATSFQSQVREWFCVMKDCGNWLRIESEPPLTSFGDKPLTNIYSSIARTFIFLWCTETELSISKRSVKEDALSLYSLCKYKVTPALETLFNSIDNISDNLIIKNSR